MHYRSRIATTLVSAALIIAGFAGPAAASTHHSSPVLGKKGLFGTHGTGWGAHRPRHIYNGGDANGDVTGVHWYSWGEPTANGHGSGWAFKPGGGYYSKPVRVEFHATGLGHCTTHGPFAYRVLRVREQVKPGSKKYTSWTSWAGSSSICTLHYVH